MKKIKLKNIVVIGHEPIASLRDSAKMNVYKSKKKPEIPVLNEEGRKLLFDIYNEWPTAINYYMCADVHNYQNNIITMTETESGQSITINEYVVGTGGAKLDICPEQKTYLATPTSPVKYSIKTQNTTCFQGNGYLYVKGQPESLIVEFHSIQYITRQSHQLGELNSKIS